MEKNGSVTVETRENIRKAMEDEVASIEKQLAAWEKNADSTAEQDKNAHQLAKTLGQLKAQLDVLDAVYTVDLRADAGPAYSELQKFIKVGEGEDVRLEINPEWEKANKEMLEARKKQEAKPINIEAKADAKPLQKDIEKAKTIEGKKPLDVEVKADTRAFDTRMKEVKRPTSSDHKVDPNTRQIDSVINRIQRPTSSTHTIYERIVPARANGGPIGGIYPYQRLAGGGTFTGSGKVPGYDPTDSDSVNAKLTRGEFVIKREAVKKFGVKMMYDINNMRFRMPKIPGYATGGEVGSPSSSNVIGGNVVPININIGNKSFQMMSDRDVAEALHRYIKNEGGL
jgi:hypothetical protein